MATGDMRRTVEANKALARRWVQAINGRDSVALGALLADDFLYSGMGRMPREIAVRWNKEEFIAIVIRAQARMPQPVVMTVTHELGEGNRVTFEIEGYGVMRDGFVYANAYCLLYEINAAQIRSVRDYCCTHTAVLAAEHAGESIG